MNCAAQIAPRYMYYILGTTSGDFMVITRLSKNWEYVLFGPRDWSGYYYDLERCEIDDRAVSLNLFEDEPRHKYLLKNSL